MMKVYSQTPKSEKNKQTNRKLENPAISIKNTFHHFLDFSSVRHILIFLVKL